MRLRDAALLGAVQGIAEAAPISSSAHVSALRGRLGLADLPRAFDVALHLGSAGAVIVTAWPDIADLLRMALGETTAERTPRTCTASELRLPVNLLIASLPAVVVGACVAGGVRHRSRDGRVSAGGLTLGSALMALSGWARPAPTTRTVQDMRWRQSLAIGIAQAAALLPGVSRSGATVATARVVGLDAETGSRFSALMAAPVMIAAAMRGAAEMPDVARTVGLRSLAVGIGAAFVGSVGGFALLRGGRMLQSVWPWVVYRSAWAAWLLWRRSERDD